METFDDNTRKELDLNPRQFYIILREDNEQYHKLYKEIAEASENDEIRFCIIDTTIPGNPTLEKKTDLYKKLMSKDGEGNTWDFIIRDYPTNGKFSFSCWHRVSDDENDIKKNLNSWRNDKERVMWEKITRTFCGYFAKNTSTKSKIRVFYDTIDEILQSKGVPSARHKKERDNLGCNLESYNGDKSIKLVKNFVGENMSKIDAFFNVKSREKSDEYMRCFFETGGYIARPKLKIVNTGNVYNGGVHDKYRLKVTTTSGRTEEVTFSSTNSFAMYIFYMVKNFISIYKEDFYPNENTKKEVAKENCEDYLAIYAAISGGLGGNPYTVIPDDKGKAKDDNKKIKKVIDALKNLSNEKESFWKNANSMNTAFKEQLGEYEAEPFLIQSEESNVDERNRRVHEYKLIFNPDDLDCENRELNRDISANKRRIQKLNIFNSDNENTPQSVH